MLYSLISVLIFGLDSKIKHEVEEKVEEGSVHHVWHDRLLIRKHHNKGVVLNAFDSHQKLMASVSAGFTVLTALLGMDAFLDKQRSTAGKLGFAFVLGGALSNTMDRIKRGYVVDYVSFHVKWTKLKNIVFNISDFFIMGGAVLTALFGDSKKK